MKSNKFLVRGNTDATASGDASQQGAILKMICEYFSTSFLTGNTFRFFSRSLDRLLHIDAPEILLEDVPLEFITTGRIIPLSIFLEISIRESSRCFFTSEESRL